MSRMFFEIFSPRTVFLVQSSLKNHFVKNVKKQIQDFIDNLNLNVSKELNMGKPEMYLKKHNIHID